MFGLRASERAYLHQGTAVRPNKNPISRNWGVKHAQRLLDLSRKTKKKLYDVILNDNIKKDPKEREYDCVQWFYIYIIYLFIIYFKSLSVESFPESKK